MPSSDMYLFANSFGLLLASFILSAVDARHTVFVSHTGEKTLLPSSSVADVCMTPACVIAAANVLTSLDPTVDPCDDFYSFACGGWLKKQEVSEEEPEVNLFVTTQNDLDRKLRELLESKYKSSDPPFVKMIKDFYNTCVDLDAIEKQGSGPLEKILRILGGWPVVEGSDWDESSFDWVDALISFRKIGLDFEIMLDLYVMFDPRNETNNIIYFEDPYMNRLAGTNFSIGLEDSEIAAYYRMMVKAAKLLGVDESTAEKEMLDALHFEIDLIKIMQKDEEKKENKTVITITELQNELPQVPWLKIINGLLLVEHVDENEYIVSGMPSFLVKFADLITSTDKRVIANYMLWRAVLEAKDYLSEEWKDIEEVKEHDKPSKKSKSEKEYPRWKTCLNNVERFMEIGLSSYYIRTYFSDESKDEAMMLMKYIHKEFLKLLENNDWMDEETRKKAEEKANAIKSYIGYPKELLNDTFVMNTFENLIITADSYLNNILALRKRQKDRRFGQLRKISEESERLTDMKYSSLIEVNAFYSPMENSIAIPAGILHDAFYDKDKPEYMNFADIGYIIGHEITHGFDNQGRHYDKNGKEVMWWDKESDEQFEKKAKCIVDQYNNYTTFVGEKVNGEKTQNENIADNGGLKEAYLAYQSWVEDHGTEPLLPGVDYTQNQIFWLSAARVWCSKYEPERLKKLLVIDVHSPSKFRIIGPMSNLDEFSKDFKCSADAPMNRKYKCEVW